MPFPPRSAAQGVDVAHLLGGQ
ncbi:hypothetical protein DKT69_11845 [Micromonospora sicca]|uniref:Uncharacterized protein n=1 Tax=Micromonospora sicca TaxID=2202420 RepID=A0A317DR12_9ACTN|nr:hypothetical protein DKT69_11845 [Micromonospora sp. 4G51]